MNIIWTKKYLVQIIIKIKHNKLVLSFSVYCYIMETQSKEKGETDHGYE